MENPLQFVFPFTLYFICASVAMLEDGLTLSSSQAVVFFFLCFFLVLLSFVHSFRLFVFTQKLEILFCTRIVKHTLFYSSFIHSFCCSCSPQYVFFFTSFFFFFCGLFFRISHCKTKKKKTNTNEKRSTNWFTKKKMFKF